MTRKVGGTNISSLFSTRRRRGLEKITAPLFLATELRLRLPNDFFSQYPFGCYNEKPNLKENGEVSCVVLVHPGETRTCHNAHDRASVTAGPCRHRPWLSGECRELPPWTLLHAEGSCAIHGPIGATGSCPKTLS